MIALNFLGEPRLERDGQPLPPFKSRKVLALLAYLALNPGWHSRSQLAGLLWSDFPERKALDNLRFALWNLTEILGEGVLETNRLEVAWQASPEVQLDTEAFLAALWQARLPAGQPETPASIQALEKALQLYRGDLLAGFELPQDLLFNEWLHEQRLYLQTLAGEALYRLVYDYLAHRRLPAAITAARRLLELDPWREEVHRLLMLALARNGERSAALAQYATCKRILREELGTLPTAQTVRLYERIRAASIASHYPLPVPLTPFIGRARELDELLRLLADPACRLLTIVGPGGVGKTRLALQAAAACADSFLNGVAWVSFEAVTAPERLLPTLADYFGLEWRTETVLEQLGYFFHNRELLLVLDNLEQLQAGAGQLAELLRRAPDLKLLVTSRERLNLQSEWLFPLSGLAVPRAGEADLTAFDAVQFFVQTARRLQGQFTLQPADAAAIQQICQLVEGMPLALELAAALVNRLTVVDIAHLVKRHLTLLTTTWSDMPPRHRSLQAVFQSAWNTLNDAERAALRGLAVFQGGFSLAAAEEVARLEPSVLTVLAGRGWLRAEGPGRYGLFETLRQFILEQSAAEPAEKSALQRRHGVYFLAWLADRQAALRTGQTEALSQVERELENVRLAWRWAIEQAEPTLLAQAAEGLGTFLELRSRPQEGRDFFAQAHALALQAGGATGAHLLAWEGLFALRLADYLQARELLETAQQLLRAAPNPNLEAVVLNTLGLVAERLGHREAARRYLEESIQQARAGGAELVLARALNNLGYWYHLDGEELRAQALLEQALAIRQRWDDRPGIAKTLINLAVVWGALGQPERVRTAYQESLAIFQELGNRLGRAVCLNNLGFQAFRQQQYAEARQLYEQALALRREIGDGWGIAVALDNLGATYCELGDYAAAREAYAEALLVAREIHATRRLVEVIVGLGRLAAREGRLAWAVELLTLALSHPAIGGEGRQAGEHLLAELTARLPPAELEAAVARGRALELDDLVNRLLAGGLSRP